MHIKQYLAQIKHSVLDTCVNIKYTHIFIYRYTSHTHIYLYIYYLFGSEICNMGRVQQRAFSALLSISCDGSKPGGWNNLKACSRTCLAVVASRVFCCDCDQSTLWPRPLLWQFGFLTTWWLGSEQEYPEKDRKIYIRPCDWLSLGNYIVSLGGSLVKNLPAV